MANQKLSELKVGIFVFVAIVIVVATAFWAKGFLVGKETIVLKAYFKNVTGLLEGDLVSVNGVKKGKVIGIELVGDSVEVRFKLEKDVKIKRDYQIEVATVELMGGKQLLIYPGSDPQEINYSQPLSGNGSTDISSALRNISNLAGDTKELINKFSKVTDNIDKVLLNVNEIIGDPAMRSDLKLSINNLRTTTGNLNKLILENKSSIRNLTDKAGYTFDNVNSLIDSTKPGVTDVLENMQKLTVKVDSLVTNVSLLVGDVQQKRSGLGKFIYDEKFFDMLNNTLLEIQKLTEKIRKDGIKLNLF